MKLLLLIFYTFLICLNLSSCTEEEVGPKDVVRGWLTHLQNGECEKALALEIDNSYHQYHPVQFDCEPYKGEIKTINCETTEESSICTTYELREKVGIQKYEYDLKKVDGEWRIAANH